jgi:hypothetical protein
MSNVINIYPLTWYFTTCKSSVELLKKTLFIQLYRDIPVQESKNIANTSFLYQFRGNSILATNEKFKDTYLIQENLRSSYREQCPYLS